MHANNQAFHHYSWFLLIGTKYRHLVYMMNVRVLVRLRGIKFAFTPNSRALTVRVRFFLSLFLACFLSFFLIVCEAKQAIWTDKFNHPAYIGVAGGYGSTTWKGLVPLEENQNLAMSLSTPLSVSEGGGVWGFFAGYELSPYFAIEANYLAYPHATVSFSELSFFAFTYDGRTEFSSHTEVVNLMGKIMLIVPRTNFRIYSGAGIANVHRYDIYADLWRLAPTFGAGVSFHVNEHVLVDIGANYTAGYGESQLDPTETYFPFLYSVALRLAYSF